MSFFSVKNYEQFQHYKDRSPPWIKFYNSVLDDYDFTSLPDASRSHLVAIWLLASRTNNRIPYDSEWVRMAIKATTKVDLGLLEKAGFIIKEQPCSETLATCSQVARPERETEEEREREKRERRVEAPLVAHTTRGTRFPHENQPEPWKQFCLETRPDLDPSATFDRCRDYWIAQPGQRGVKRDWDATWRNWVRNERAQPGVQESAFDKRLKAEIAGARG